jgi:NAD(P)-dependent dehydrogenase (short-subunit alcohol dehydrogenase family)
MHVAGSTIVVSGGASGLGAAVARMVVEADGSVAILDSNASTGASTAASLGRAQFYHVDVTDPVQVEGAMTAARKDLGGIHGVVCAAGIAPAARVMDREGHLQEPDFFARVVAVNLMGTFNVIRASIGHLARNHPDNGHERGVIVLTASIAAFDGQVGQSAYAASKGGVVGMTLPLAREFARTGVRVVTVAPGIFRTPLLADLPEPSLDSLAQQVPFPARLGQAEEFAALVRHIFENQMLNGTTIRLDGALRMAPR